MRKLIFFIPLISISILICRAPQRCSLTSTSDYAYDEGDDDAPGGEDDLPPPPPPAPKKRMTMAEKIAAKQAAMQQNKTKGL